MLEPDQSTAGHRPPGPTGVIGIGEIGSGIASVLLRAGVELTVCDVRSAATKPFAGRARVANTPGQLASHCTTVVVAVVDDAQVTAVLTGPDGLMSGARPGLAVVVVSTVAVRTIAELAKVAAAGDVALVDCGVSGGATAAADGELVCMVGGLPHDVKAVRPVLDVIGSTVLEMGPLGAGLSAKLARNLIQYGSWLAAYEAQRLAEAAGIDLIALGRAVRASDVTIGGASTLMFRSTVAPFRADADASLVSAMRAAASLAHKDLAAIQKLAAEVGVALPVTALTEEYCDRVFGLAPATQGHDPGPGAVSGSTR